jgi:hypothetical protein
MATESHTEDSQKAATPPYQQANAVPFVSSVQALQGPDSPFVRLEQEMDL